MNTTDTDTTMMDITKPNTVVEVMVSNDGSVIWVNVDGVCRLRVSRIPHLLVLDMREEKSK
jgi:hypothetical protein